ncbi:hypothetical protein FVE85_7785 [Porphyridium purpureum]|uniref:Uncharacterized protein n=1 Tax=Porphyridium purpureum TaxID=35688 RepID=A0A5J4YKX1_PORPP|nr:hypothetical protein FVE85_7785 [Porphyridium purpureum]|eukprot:POR2317..scf210_14
MLALKDDSPFLLDCCVLDPKTSSATAIYTRTPAGHARTNVVCNGHRKLPHHTEVGAKVLLRTVTRRYSKRILAVTLNRPFTEKQDIPFFLQESFTKLAFASCYTFIYLPRRMRG